MKKNKNRLILTIASIILLGLSSFLSSSESYSKELVNDFLSGGIAKEKLYDADFLATKLEPSGSSIFDQALMFFQSGISSQEFLIQREIWKTLAQSNPAAATIAYAEHLAVVPSKSVAAMFEIAASSDYTESSERPWDFSQYQPILAATRSDPFDRLIAYMLQQSPGDALKQLIDVYGDNLDAEQRKQIVIKGLRITDHLRNHGNLFELRSSSEESFREGGIGQMSMDFFLELQSLDEWYLDAFVAAALEKSGTPNVSPELNEYFKSKPKSLANKLRQDDGLAFLPVQKISLSTLKRGLMTDNRVNQRQEKFGNHQDKRIETQRGLDEVENFHPRLIITAVLSLVIAVLLFKVLKGKTKA